VFKDFLRKRLRKYGLKKTYLDVSKIIINTLSYALQALQIDKCERSVRPNEQDHHFHYHLMPLHPRCIDYLSQFPLDDEKLRYGVKSDSFQRLGLPSFRTIYLYLNNVILTLMHICIKMQIKMQNAADDAPKTFKYSLLSIEVLTNECRECIEQAILVRQFYYHMVYSVIENGEMDVQAALENDLVDYDADLKQIIEIYLQFITDWVHDLVENNDLAKALWVLDDEWRFCKNNLFYVTDSEENTYAKQFCNLSGFLNSSLFEILRFVDSEYKQKLMEYSHDSNLQSSIDTTELVITPQPSENAFSTSEETESAKHNILYEIKEEPSKNDQDSQSDDVEIERDSEQEEEADEVSDVNLKCNELKEEINRLRKISMKSLKFCGKLIADLELAAKYEVTSSVQELLDELAATNHVLVHFTNTQFESTDSSTTPPFMIFIPHEFSKDKIQIVRLLFIISEKDDYDPNYGAALHNSNKLAFLLLF
jgi:hypothetical protein